MNLVADLISRGLFQQASDPETDAKLGALAAKRPIAAYAGFDPTADSLHVGNFVAILGLMYAQKNGIRPIAIVGGATGLIGDPSGKTSERQLQTKEAVARNVEGIRRVQFHLAGRRCQLKFQPFAGDQCTGQGFIHLCGDMIHLSIVVLWRMVEEHETLCLADLCGFQCDADG